MLTAPGGDLLPLCAHQATTMARSQWSGGCRGRALGAIPGPIHQRRYDFEPDRAWRPRSRLHRSAQGPHRAVAAASAAAPEAEEARPAAVGTLLVVSTWKEAATSASARTRSRTGRINPGLGRRPLHRGRPCRRPRPGRSARPSRSQALQGSRTDSDTRGGWRPRGHAMRLTPILDQGNVHTRPGCPPRPGQAHSFPTAPAANHTSVKSIPPGPGRSRLRRAHRRELRTKAPAARAASTGRPAQGCSRQSLEAALIARHGAPNGFPISCTANWLSCR